jgi:hypothetical protein
LSQGGIRSQDRQAEQGRLCHEQAIERVSVQRRERRDGQSVRVLDSECLRAHRTHTIRNVSLRCFGERQLP